MKSACLATASCASAQPMPGNLPTECRGRPQGGYGPTVPQVRSMAPAGTLIAKAIPDGLKGLLDREDQRAC
jgi:hypothetical protein